MKELYKIQAEICKTLANPKRLEIINALKDGEKCVSELVEMLKIPKANLSQHLSLLKSNGIVASRREGVNIYYHISSPKIIKACALMKEVLKETLDERTRVLKEVLKTS
ncbi:MAG: winged helix-turn-helix transcriptional regulator [Deltaproteobacteria bacterium]|nr:winged helix-turn-helix transcriptional regulator [Deltaproteobacteria bacterium]